MEYTNGTWNIVGSGSRLGEILGVSLTQYDALMQRLQQIQTSFDRLAEREAQRATDHASFVTETKLRLTMVEKQILEHISQVKEQADIQEEFRGCVQRSLEELRQQTAAIDQKADRFPNEIKSQWKAVSLFLSGGMVVLGAVWAFLQGLWWVYQNIFTKVGN